jgi:predicted nucleic acid-binding protein
MPSQNIVVDEWLLHDLSGENGRKAQGQAYRFLLKLKDKCDRLVVLRGSVWAQKAYALMKSLDREVQRLSKFLHRGILQDLQKCRYFETNEIHSLSQDVASQIPRKDVYLVEVYCSSGADMLLTTDGPLRDVLRDVGTVNVRLREEFLTEYLK